MAKSLLQRKLEFIEKSKKKFGDKFNYDKVDYKDATTPVILICKIHGEFEMTPKAHLVSTTGCKECSKHVIRKQKTLIDGQEFQNELKSRQVVSAQPGIYLGDLSKISIVIPETIKEQTKIGNFFKQLDDTIALHQRKV